VLCAAPPATKSLSLGDRPIGSVTDRGVVSWASRVRGANQRLRPPSCGKEIVNERQEPEESEETLAQALQRVKNAVPPERIEGKPETAKIPFAEFDEAEKGG
jgi:hypothetical protein